MKNLPADTRALIEELDREYPHRCIRPNESPEAAHRYAGARSLIDYLISLRDRADRRHEDRILE